MKFLMGELQPLQACPPHVNVIRLYGICKDGTYTKSSGKVVPVIYAVQEYAPMDDLFFYVKHSAFEDSDIRHMARQLFQGIKWMKDNGFCHRDLKPENVCLDADFNLKIIDWGFATPYEPGNTTRSYKGTKCFMAPELLAREAYEPHNVDMFALGCCLYVLKMRAYPWTMAKYTVPYSYFFNENPAKFWQYVTLKT